MKNYLFVCGQNQVRSPAAASYFSYLLLNQNPSSIIEKDNKKVKLRDDSLIIYEDNNKTIDYVVKSAGMFNCSNIFTKELANNSDVIFAMDEEIYNEIIKKYEINPQKLVNLDILDVYSMFWGKLSDLFLDGIIIRFRSDEEKKQSILNRPEIIGKLNLSEVLESKKDIFLQYI
jgi:predicted protein tyrosine phosphatase